MFRRPWAVAASVFFLLVCSIPGTRANAGAEPSSAAATSRIRAAAIGDSIMLGAEGSLQHNGIAVYAAKDRAFIQGIDVVQNLRASRTLPPTVVIHLGTNGPVSRSLFDEMMADLKGERRVVFLTVKGPVDWESEVNIVLAAGVRRWPNARLIDWHALASAHPGWLWSDETHLTPIGAIRYAQIIARAVR